MIGSGLSIIIELVVSLLLVVTIGYCYVVNRKLTALRTDQSGLRQVIVELNRSSERAEQAIGQMRRTAQAVDGDIASQCEVARKVRDELVEAMERSRSARAILEKFGDLDLSALKKLGERQVGGAVNSQQMVVAKELKRQRLGFGREQMGFEPKAKAAAQPMRGQRGDLNNAEAETTDLPRIAMTQRQETQHNLALAMERLQAERQAQASHHATGARPGSFKDNTANLKGEDSWAVAPGALMRGRQFTAADQQAPLYRESA